MEFCPEVAYSKACRASVLQWTRSHGDNFFVDLGSSWQNVSSVPGMSGHRKRGRSSLALKRLTYFMPKVLACSNSSRPLVMVDAGAGIHGLSPEWALNATRLHTDDSDSLWLLAGFGAYANVHAFEINKVKA